MNLPVDAKINLLSEIINDYVDYIDSNGYVPSEKSYRITSLEEDRFVKQAARQAAFNNFSTPIHSPLVKFAFDTRHINQENERNPRTNLQYWHRAQQFIDENDDKKLKIFARLANLLTNLKKTFGTAPEWFESYARQLYDNVHRIIRVKEADFDIFRPQLAYLEQLIYARYRLSMENIEKYSDKQLQDCILSKDESLIGRNNYLKEVKADEEISSNTIMKNTSIEKNTQESIINAIFGANSNFRKDGEKTVSRTITIKITDEVVD